MVLLTFDIEEFDLPQEYGQAIEIAEQIAISSHGLERILEVLEAEQIPATFYSTLTYFELMPSSLRARLLSGGHEVASHGVHHSSFEERDYALSLQGLSHLSGQTVQGYRMARMQPIDHSRQREAGYVYDSSLNPTYLPGRYNHLRAKRLPHLTDSGVWSLPASVTPIGRIPLFWLSLHLLPKWLYYRLASYTARHDDYLNVYFHPWEFADLRQLPYKLPSYICRHSGVGMQDRLRGLIQYLKQSGLTFSTTSNYLRQHIDR